MSSLHLPNLPSQWFLPTFHGDILLESKGDHETLLRAFELTPSEKSAMEALRARAISEGLFKKAWAKESDFAHLTDPAYMTKDGVTVKLRAPITEVQELLARTLKPGAALLHAVRFTDGKLEEITAKPKTYRELKKDKPKPKAETNLAKPKADKAVTVAQPTIGCPAPVFEQAEIRATRVLEAFLSPEQLEDYRSEGAFVATGADSGHRYMLVHREQQDVYQHYKFRSIYDLDEQRPLCVHDWTVPAPEELLALFLCVSLPGRESVIRHMPEVFE